MRQFQFARRWTEDSAATKCHWHAEKTKKKATAIEIRTSKAKTDSDVELQFLNLDRIDVAFILLKKFVTKVGILK